jgi:hypothetical protein
MYTFKCLICNRHVLKYQNFSVIVQYTMLHNIIHQLYEYVKILLILCDVTLCNLAEGYYILEGPTVSTVRSEASVHLLHWTQLLLMIRLSIPHLGSTKPISDPLFTILSTGTALRPHSEVDGNSYTGCSQLRILLIIPIFTATFHISCLKMLTEIWK